MANQRVVDYIKEQLSKGFAAEQIRQGLLSQGWQSHDVEEAMQLVPPGEEPSRPQPKSSVPGLVKFFAVLLYIGAGFSLLKILENLALGGGITIFNFIIPAGVPDWVVFILPIITNLGLAVLYVFTGIGLWRARRWTRKVMIAFSIIGIISSALLMIPLNIGPISTNPTIIGIAGGIIGLIISALIGIYFLFSKKVKAAFA